MSHVTRRKESAATLPLYGKDSLRRCVALTLVGEVVYVVA